MTQEQRTSQQRNQLNRSGNITVAPGKVSTPYGVAGIKAHVRQEQRNTHDCVRLHRRAESLPGDHAQENHENEERIEKKDRLLGLEKRSEKPDVPGGFERIVGRQRRIHHPGFAANECDLGVEERSETMVLVEAVKQTKKQVYGKSNGDVAATTVPKAPAADALQPQDKQQEERSRQKIQTGWKPGEQVETERRRA